MFNQKPSKIVTTNRLPFLIGVAVFILILGIFLFKTQANHKTFTSESKPRQLIDISSKTADNSWFNDDKFKNIKLIGQSVSQPLTSKQAAAFKKQEAETDYATQIEIQKIEDKNKIEAKKLELEAVNSPLSIEVPPPPGTHQPAKSSPKRNDLVTDTLSEMTNMLKSETTPDKASALAGLGAQLINDFNNQSGKQTFLQKSADQPGDYLDSAKKKPRSRYEVKAGSYIPAALITGINSDLPGSVNAQVTQNVFDSTTGNFLLIPQGAKLVGEYNSSLTFGQQRVQVVWNRIIFPDGQSLDIEKVQGVDIAGYTGFFDKVNNHYLRIYGNAVLLSLMGAGYDILNQNTNQGQQFENPRDIVAAHVGQKLADVSGQTLERNMNVQPTLVINPGYKFNVMVMKDMVLEKIKDVEGALAYSG